MNPDPTRPGPDDDVTAGEPGRDAVDTMALEAVTAIATPSPEDDAAAIRDENDPMVGRRIGPYRLLSRIGGGAMGSVYLADRVEGLAQRVVVELTGRGVDGEEAVRRSRAERPAHEAMARHPNIAGLIDAGIADDGRPYFVREYVEGRRIDEYCDEHLLDVPARLRLFATACGAVQFAHQHAMIHRSLKPGRILVTEDGVPEVVGFGVAGLIDRGAVADGPGAEDPMSEYAGPEQVMGEPATTASDVHALGVILYHLLTGRGPYRFRTGSVAEVVQAICEQAPERPSTAVVRGLRPAPSTGPTPADPSPEEVAAARGTTPAALRRALAGDLDAIVLMAMRQEPERRYASAGELADDLRRHLDGLPVRARADATLYRAGRFVRRNARAVAAASLLLLALVGGVVGTSWALVLAHRGRDRAEASSRQAWRAVDRFFTRFSEERRLDQPGMHALRQELLRDARGFYERFLTEHGADPSMRVERAAARSRMARITAEIGTPAEADEPYRRAIAEWEGLLASQPGDAEYQEGLAAALDGRAEVLMRLEGRGDEAEAAFARARELAEKALAADPASIRRRELLGRVLRDSAQLQSRRGRPREAIETLRRALETEEALAAADPGAIGPRLHMARARALMGQILAEQPDGIASALASYQQAVETLEAVTREHPELADQAQALALELGHMSTAQQEAGKLDSALDSGRRSIEILEGLDRRYPDVADYRGGLARAYNLVSDLHRRRGEPDDSLALAEKARPLLERLVAEHPEETPPRIELSRSYSNIGRVQQQAGDAPEALRSFRRAVDLLEGLPELDPANSYDLACNLSLCIPLIGAPAGSHGRDDEEITSPGDRVRRRVYGDRAIEVLRRAVRGGLLDARALQSDPDLAAIRRRDDFRRLVEDVEKQETDRPLKVNPATSPPPQPAERAGWP